MTASPFTTTKSKRSTKTVATVITKKENTATGFSHKFTLQKNNKITMFTTGTKAKIFRKLSKNRFKINCFCSDSSNWNQVSVTIKLSILCHRGVLKKKALCKYVLNSRQVGRSKTLVGGGQPWEGCCSPSRASKARRRTDNTSTSEEPKRKSDVLVVNNVGVLGHCFSFCWKLLANIS